MKLVETLLDGRQLELARRALRIRGISGFTVSFVVVLVAAAPGAEDERRSVPEGDRTRIKIEIVAHDDLVGRVVEALSGTLHAGHEEGEIHVAPVHRALRIRSDEIDEAAIS